MVKKASKRKGGDVNSFVNKMFGDNSRTNDVQGIPESLQGSPLTTGGAKRRGRKPAAKPRKKIVKIPTMTRGGTNLAPLLTALITVGLRIANGDTLKRKTRGGNNSCGAVQNGGNTPSLENFLSNIEFEGGNSILGGDSSQYFEFGNTSSGGRRGRKRRSVSPKRSGRKPGRKSRGGEGDITVQDPVPGLDGGAKRRGRKPQRRSVSPQKRTKKRGGTTGPTETIETTEPSGTNELSGTNEQSEKLDKEPSMSGGAKKRSRKVVKRSKSPARPKRRSPKKS